MAMDKLPKRFSDWFASRGWTIHPIQQQMLQRAQATALLLIAPTGGGKTLAGFLPSLIELSETSDQGLHTVYISPLKALAADIKRNLRIPVSEIGLQVRIEDRTGDTPTSRKRRQRADPPHILLTTPESLALLISYEDAHRMFAGLKRIIIDEIHALAESKRGDQLMLSVSRLARLCPSARRIGLSATVDDPLAIGQFLSARDDQCQILTADPGPKPNIAMLQVEIPPPWAGGGAAYAIPEVMAQIKQHQTTLVFHNTRAQAEIFFHKLWLANEDSLPIGIHHGSLDRVQRTRVEAAMVGGELRAIICTGSLDLGIDWGNVDLVIQIGAPKNVKRLVQRIGRANHSYNTPSKALLVPANRFEVVECLIALRAVENYSLDGEARGRGPLDVLCQQILIAACAGPFNADALFQEIHQTGSYYDLTRDEFDACLDFCATGGYALRGYDRWQRLIVDPNGDYRLRDPRSAVRIRMNIGTIQETDTLKVRLQRSRGSKPLGEIEESFAATLSKGDTFLIGGQVVRYEGLKEMSVEVTRQTGKTPKIATFMGTKFATSTQLSAGILNYFKRADWSELPAHTAEWLALQQRVSRLPHANRLLIETFPDDGRQYLCAYGFAGRNAQQTLGLLVTKRMEELGQEPLGFVATDYATLVWGLTEVEHPAALFEDTALEQGFDDWLAGNAVMKRTFRTSATIAGLIERNLPGKRKSGRQATFSSDILYDTLIKYDPEHLLLKITRGEAMRGLVDFERLREMTQRIAGKIDHIRLGRVSPLAAPLFLEAGQVPIAGAAQDRLLNEAADALMRKAGLTP